METEQSINFYCFIDCQNRSGLTSNILAYQMTKKNNHTDNLIKTPEMREKPTNTRVTEIAIKRILQTNAKKLSNKTKDF